MYASIPAGALSPNGNTTTFAEARTFDITARLAIAEIPIHAPYFFAIRPIAAAPVKDKIIHEKMIMSDAMLSRNITARNILN